MAYCDRDTKQWVLQYEDGSTVRVQSAVINNVEFDRETIAGSGCGTSYRGFAKGEHTTGELAENVDMTNARRIEYESGMFYDRKKREKALAINDYEKHVEAEQKSKLRKFSKLIMLKDCSSRYIP